MVFLCLGIDVLSQTKGNFDADVVLFSYNLANEVLVFLENALLGGRANSF
jgi:hypothetical protein